MVSFRPVNIGLWDPFQMAELHGWNKWGGDPFTTEPSPGSHPTQVLFGEILQDFLSLYGAWGILGGWYIFMIQNPKQKPCK